MIKMFLFFFYATSEDKIAMQSPNLERTTPKIVDLLSGSRFFNQILCQIKAHDKTLIRKKCYIKHANGFRNIECQRDYQLLQKYDFNNS